MTLGAVFRPQSSAGLLAEAAEAAEAAGVDEIWLWEDCFLHGGIASAAIVLANSSTVSVGIGVLPVPLRNVALTAMEIATLENAFPGRVRAGVGHGVQDWMRQVGAGVSSPMTLLREHLTCLRGLLRGDVVTFEGRYVNLRDVQLDWIPSGDVPMLCAATGPKTLRLSGELATGTVLTGGTTVDELRTALRHIDAGRDAGGVTAAHEVVAYVEAPPDAAEAAGLVRQYRDSGATTVALQTGPDSDPIAFVNFVGSLDLT